jgi:zinc protease
LDNGVQVIIDEDHSHPVVSAQVWVKVGSVNEDVRTAGLSHFLEHLIFKGTAKYPGNDISIRVETQGGVINAATSKEFTHFYIDIQKSGWKDAVRILADAMANAAFPADEIENERPVVIEEIRRHLDNPGSVLYDLFSESMFPATPYRSSIIGTEDVIRRVTRDEISAYYHEHYVPSNMIVSIAGDVTAAEALQLARETFGAQKQGKAPRDPDLIEPPHEPKTVRETKDVEHEYWIGGFLGPTITSNDQFAADLTAMILGGGRSSRLYRILREEKQLVYAISASFWSQRGSGTMVLHAVFAPEREKETLAELRAIIDGLAAEGPTDTELKRAKELTRSQWYFGKETPHEQASLRGYWYMQGNPAMAERYLAGIEAVTNDDIIRFLKTYYTTPGLSQAVLIPAH